MENSGFYRVFVENKKIVGVYDLYQLVFLLSLLFLTWLNLDKNLLSLVLSIGKQRLYVNEILPQNVGGPKGT